MRRVNSGEADFGIVYSGDTYLGRNGKLLIVAAALEPIQVSPLQLIGGRRTVAGWPSGHAKDSEAVLGFSTLTGVRPMIETFPLEKVTEAYETMINNRARFRVVLTMQGKSA